MARVFISFVHEDRSVADALKALIEHELKLDGQVFMVTDQEHLKPGDDWLDTIRKGLAGAEIILLMLSKRSITKPWVNFEAGAGWLANKRVIPVCFGYQLKGKLPAPYSHLQAVYLPDDEYMLLDTIADVLGVQRPSLIEKVMKVVEKDKKPKSTIGEFLELTRDVRAALKLWTDET